MRKLKLESLTVESFETVDAAPRARGTVEAHGKPQPPTTLQTYNVDICGDTMYFDCTLACSHLTNCSQCWQSELCLTEVDCV